LLDEVVDRWQAPVAALSPAEPIRLTCLTTPGDDDAIGAIQEAIIEAPLSSVAALLDDFPHYRDLFPGVVDVRLVPGSQAGDRFVTAWEQEAPVFFLRNVRFELVYQVDRADPGRVRYRYWLRRPGAIRRSDGAVLLEALDGGRTRFTEFDLLESSWGPLPRSLVWGEALQGMFLSDLALKLKAEHPDWTYTQVADQARRRWRATTGLADRCRAGARPAPSPPAP
jgi:hypothetical protein